MDPASHHPEPLEEAFGTRGAARRAVGRDRDRRRPVYAQYRAHHGRRQEQAASRQAPAGVGTGA